jgi:hypothetical protein
MKRKGIGLKLRIRKGAIKELEHWIASPFSEMEIEVGEGLYMGHIIKKMPRPFIKNKKFKTYYI